ncbi:unnamed protein product, partial [Prorocentrum cordatum]
PISAAAPAPRCSAQAERRPLFSWVCPASLAARSDAWLARGGGSRGAARGAAAEGAGGLPGAAPGRAGVVVAQRLRAVWRRRGARVRGRGPAARHARGDLAAAGRRRAQRGRPRRVPGGLLRGPRRRGPGVLRAAPLREEEECPGALRDPGPGAAAYPERGAECRGGGGAGAPRHPESSVEIRLVVPRRSRFRHLKLALARHLDNDEILRRGFFVQKVGTYTNHRDDSLVGDIKEVLVAGISIGDAGGERPATVLEDGEVTSDDEAAEANPRGPSWVAKLEEKLAQVEERQVKATGSKLTYKDAISINQELLEGFRDETFQQQLRALGEASCGRAEFLRKRQELFLFVQRKVLPRYGFEGSQTGVLKMIGEMRPYVDIPQFAKLRQEIYGLLGLDMPERSAKDFSKDCAELAVADAQLAAGVTKSYIASRIS